ncbi:MAG: peptide deformylase [Clostridia bacterium]|nr:peptide deformylase [Clostridia bacterium]
MAIREIRKTPDEVLYKKSREVTDFDERLHTLLDDMADTMYEANGVGLAAVQVGILKRVVVIDVGDGIMELINPVIIETKDSQTGTEGCLSFPGQWGIVTRPNYVKVKALDRFGNEQILEGRELLARAFCHEIEHLDGHAFVEKVERFVDPDAE